MIDFADSRGPLRELIENSLSGFASEHADVTWSTFALYACPWGGWITTSFDTKEKSAEIVAEISASGRDWFGEDEWGRFNDNCPDFQFHDWRGLELPSWQTECEEAEPIHVRDLSGRDHFIGCENEALNGLAFGFMRTVLLEQLESLRGSPVFPKSRHRFGVQLLDSLCSKYWRSPEVSGQRSA